jgi:hypothetical protein
MTRATEARRLPVNRAPFADFFLSGEHGLQRSGELTHVCYPSLTHPKKHQFRDKPSG